MTTNGHMVRWKQLYRSADLSKLTARDLLKLDSLGIASDIDFRGTEESGKAPDKLNATTTYLLCPAGSEHLDEMFKAMTHTHTGGDSLMLAYYSNIAAFPERYKPFFGRLLELQDGNSLVYHCSAGKDRTGIATALFLYALDIPYETIVSDYLASNYYRQNENQRTQKLMVRAWHLQPGVAESVMGVKREYLDASFDAIRKKYGSINLFLTQELNLSPANRLKLKQRYLVKWQK